MVVKFNSLLDMDGEQIHTLISMNHVLQISCKRVVDVIRVIELSI
jgi:hypothetical protein